MRRMFTLNLKLVTEGIELIKLKIVKIIDEYKVVVNGGSAQGIKSGDILEVFEPGEQVVDPDTGASLGTLDLIKAKLRVVDLFEQMCVCTNSEDELKSAFAQAMVSSNLTKPRPLNVDATDISGGYENVSKKIKVGDLLRKAL